MHSYKEVKKNHGVHVNQTIDSPIQFLEFWDLWDCGLTLFVIMFFGIIFDAWWFMILMLIITVIVIPLIKSRNNRGVFLHIFYSKYGVELPGLFNPKGKRKFSD